MKRSILILIMAMITATSLVGCTQSDNHTAQIQTASQTEQKGFQILSGGTEVPTYDYTELQGEELKSSALKENGFIIKEE